MQSASDVPGAEVSKDRSMPFANLSFRLLFVGELISALGDQVSTIALPWLLLLLTHDPLALGTVIACLTGPRALLILSGGVVVDRLSPRAVLLRTRFVDMCIMATLAGLVYSGHVRPWMVYAIAACAGIASAFSQPASGAIVPQVVESKDLQAANGLVMGLSQIAMLVGPVLAGVIISMAGHAAGAQSIPTAGVALAFGLDAISFALAGLLLWGVKVIDAQRSVASKSMLEEIRETARFIFHDAELWPILMYYMAIALFVAGPLQVALPVLAQRALGGDSSTFGMLMSGFALGGLLGMGLSAMRPKGKRRWLGLTILALDAMAGLTLGSLGYSRSTWQAVCLLVLLGALSGFVQVTIVTWIQKRVPERMLGRAMSIFAFILLCVLPAGTVLSGMALRFIDIRYFLAALGSLLIGIVLLSLGLTPIRHVQSDD